MSNFKSTRKNDEKIKEKFAKNKGQSRIIILEKFIKKRPGLKLSELSKTTGLRKSSLRPLLKKLEVEKLIKKEKGKYFHESFDGFKEMKVVKSIQYFFRKLKPIIKKELSQKLSSEELTDFEKMRKEAIVLFSPPSKKEFEDFRQRVVLNSGIPAEKVEKYVDKHFCTQVRNVAKEIAKEMSSEN